MKAMAAPVLRRKCACGKESPEGASCSDCSAKQSRRLQKQLMIGASNDPLEREADRVADQVMGSSASPTVTRRTPQIQRYSRDVEAEGGAAPASVDAVLASPGRPMDPALREDMEQRFGYDFSGVRVHSDEAAERSARDVQAHAYTVGSNIVFSKDRFAPGTHEGRRLIAHELTHIVQQAGGQFWLAGDGRKTDSQAGQLVVGAENTGPEREANREACSVGAAIGRESVPFKTSSSVPIQTLARQAAPQPASKDEQIADMKAMRLARSPAQAIRQWRALSLNDQRLVLIRMAASYGADFTAAFLPYARGEKKPNFSTSIETGTPAALVARGFRDAGIVGGVLTWVHPSGQEVNLVSKGHDREDCANLCSDIMGESECMACCDQKVDSNNPECMSSCRATCDQRLE